MKSVSLVHKQTEYLWENTVIHLRTEIYKTKLEGLVLRARRRVSDKDSQQQETLPVLC